jgi:cardiolipin synthase
MGGSAGRLAASAIRVGNTVEAAITNRRGLGPADAKTMGFGGLVLLALAIVAMLWPLLLALPLALFAVWVGVVLLMKAWHLHRRRRHETASDRARDKIETR